MSTMKLARVHGPDDVRLDDVPAPAAGPDDVVVRVKACGICGSDLGYIHNGGLAPGSVLAQPLPLGHEFAGVVESIGAKVQGVKPGQRVAVNPDDNYIGSGAEGSMGEFILIRNAKVGSSLYPLPDHVSEEEAALAEPLSVALHGINLTHVQAGDKVAVIGAGPIGLCAVAMLRHRGVKDIAILDREQSRLDRAKALGANAAIRVSGDGDMTEGLARAHGEGNRFGVRNVGTDVFIDAAGAAPALSEAMNIAKYKARFAIIALYKKPATLDLFKMMANEIMMVGSIADSRHAEFAEALEMIAGGKIDLSPMISHRVAFDQFFDAIAIASDPAKSAKVMLTF
jgi:2-desacetyl-2-hydroxyethyl bacteriochlorophyllide A dehydrogenase